MSIVISAHYSLAHHHRPSLERRSVVDIESSLAVLANFATWRLYFEGIIHFF